MLLLRERQRISLKRIPQMRKMLRDLRRERLPIRVSTARRNKANQCRSDLFLAKALDHNRHFLRSTVSHDRRISQLEQEILRNLDPKDIGQIGANDSSHQSSKVQ